MGGEPLPVSILLVDDRPQNLATLRAILADQPGYDLVDASSGPEALRELLKRDFALILLDAFLPEMDGFEVARMIKGRERTRDIPILFLTAAGSEQALIERAYAVGAADYLVKPVSPEIVRAKVAVFVELARKDKLLQESERRAKEVELADLRMTSERRYRQLAEAIPQIVWRALPEGTFEYWNQRWFDYTGADASLSTDAAWDLIHPEDRHKCREAFEDALREGNSFQCESRIRRADGSYRWHLRRALPEQNREGEIVAWLGTDTDIDDHKRADNERIELLVRERAARFEAEASQKRAAELYVEAREAVRLRDDFLTVAAHELRTPLTTLRLQSQQIGRATASSASRSLVRSVDRLCRLVDQLLDVSRIAAGSVQLQFERADLRAVVEEAVDRLADEAQRNGCVLNLEAGGPVQAEFDPLRIEQVVANLMTNAIKYGRGKPVEVAVLHAGPQVRIEIQDHGIGIAAEEQQRIFERFTRAVSVREYGGLGLGLYISKQIVDAHDGSIRVVSEPTRGATFVVEFPADRPAPSAGPSAHA